MECDALIFFIHYLLRLILLVLCLRSVVRKIHSKTEVHYIIMLWKALFPPEEAFERQFLTVSWKIKKMNLFIWMCGSVAFSSFLNNSNITFSLKFVETMSAKSVINLFSPYIVNAIPRRRLVRMWKIISATKGICSNICFLVVLNNSAL